LKVLIVQPTVPHYRAAFFRGVHARLNGQLEIQASAKIPGGPDSVPASELPQVRCSLNHGLIAIRHNTLYWQKGLHLGDLGKGDVLFLSGNPRFLSIFPLIMKAKARGMGVIIQGHGWSSSSRPLLARIRHAMWHLGDVLFLYTDEEKAQFIENGFAPARLFAANNTIGTDDIRQALTEWPSEKLSTFQAEQGLQNKSKGPFCKHLLLQAVHHLRAVNPSIRVAIVGRGALEGALRAQAAALALDDAVIWLGEVHDESQLAPWFLSAQLFVYPGAIGLSLLHAFNYGLPVVTHDQVRQHNPEIAALAPGQNGAVFAKGDADALARSLQALLCAPATLTAMRASALDTVQSRFSTEMMVDRFMQAAQAAHQRALAA
jgi:hypothetical protein